MTVPITTKHTQDFRTERKGRLSENSPPGRSASAAATEVLGFRQQREFSSEQGVHGGMDEQPRVKSALALRRWWLPAAQDRKPLLTSTQGHAAHGNLHFDSTQEQRQKVKKLTKKLKVKHQVICYLILQASGPKALTEVAPDLIAALLSTTWGWLIATSPERKLSVLLSGRTGGRVAESSGGCNPLQGKAALGASLLMQSEASYKSL